MSNNASYQQLAGADKPPQMTMDGGVGKIEELLGDKQVLLVKQKGRDCCNECFSCEATTEYSIAVLDPDYIEVHWMITQEGYKSPAFLYAVEKSNFCKRCCWGDSRPWELTVSQGAGPGGPEVLSIKKPRGCPYWFCVQSNDPMVRGPRLDCPCCCFLPTASARLPGGAELGSSSRFVQDCECCVPKVEYSEGEGPVYLLKPETDCGCCVACKLPRKGWTYEPYYFHDPVTMEVIGGNYGNDATPKIRKLWAGGSECCCPTVTYAIFFPTGIDAKRKAGILGLGFLLGFTVFERQSDPSLRQMNAWGA